MAGKHKTQIDDTNSNNDHIFIIEQFKTLREEISYRQTRKFRILTSGLFGVPAITFVGRYFEEKFSLGEVFFLMAPVIVIVAGFLYVAENNGVMRAGRFIRTTIEPKFESVTGWESWLEENSDAGTRSIDKYINFSTFVVMILYYFG